MLAGLDEAQRGCTAPLRHGARHRFPDRRRRARLHRRRRALGKNLGDDLAEGKPTLPLIVAQRRGSPQQVEVIRAAIQGGDRAALPAVIAAIRETDALDESIERAREYVHAAQRELAMLPPSTHRDALHDLADYAVMRVS
jgi:octaprenyl-diphosphate synthase